MKTSSKSGSWEIHPRYSRWSSGPTDRSTALRAAREEWALYQGWLSGSYGRLAQSKAQEQGIGPRSLFGLGQPGGIVEYVSEHVGHRLAIDLFTGKAVRREYSLPAQGVQPRQVNSVCSRCQRSLIKSPVLVFGSNQAGRHGAGAAKEALEKWGAQWGVGEGRRGSSYALPTKDVMIQTLPLEEVAKAVERFLVYAREYPDDVFLVTRIGCGLAGFSDAQIAPMFANAPENCWLPMHWRK